ncbi:Myxococcus cysteine-rich repeat-containing protein, partial [Nannocystis exedens]
CDSDCTLAQCGDQTVNGAAGETCDSGTETATCDDDCTAVACGDEVVNESAGEVCDHGGPSPTCDLDCTFAACNDGVINSAAGESCEDGNLAEGDGCSSKCKAHKVVFATSQGFDGNLGGLVGADMKCQVAAQAAGLPGTYRAWLSDDTGSPVSRFTKSTIPYARRDGVLIANNWADLIDGTLAAPINLSELKTPPGADANVCGGTSQLTFTNTIVSGTMFTDFTDCQNWTSNAPGFTGGGQWNKADGLWTQFVCQQSCAWKKPIYCFMQ